jgi:uncharacterized protein YeaO (DUF488 family)
VAFQIRRIYEPPHPDDGYRVLIDRLWPRGVAKQTAAVDLWLKEIAPSDALRKWFAHDPAKWTEFVNRYHREVDKNPEAIETLRAAAAKHPIVTLLFAAKDEEHSNAVALKAYLSKRRITPRGSR